MLADAAGDYVHTVPVWAETRIEIPTWYFAAPAMSQQTFDDNEKQAQELIIAWKREMDAAVRITQVLVSAGRLAGGRWRGS